MIAAIPTWVGESLGQLCFLFFVAGCAVGLWKGLGGGAKK